ncbi:hypothetical protein C6A85_000000107500 [Mycobacterium sp. ITM-2017-0098]|nr:hypothetical protein C6A85_000000107500 [Mycobacterium sp. ITM-2017-0098]
MTTCRGAGGCGAGCTTRGAGAAAITVSVIAGGAAAGGSMGFVATGVEMPDAPASAGPTCPTWAVSTKPVAAIAAKQAAAANNTPGRRYQASGS